MRMNAKDVAWMKGEATYELGDMVQAASRFAARRVLAIASLHVSALFKSDISTLSELIKRIAMSCYERK